jgi:hypothetical protein
LQKVNSPLKTIAEEASPDKVVKEIITELNNEYQESAIERTPSPVSGKKQDLVDSQPSKSEDLKTSQMGPQRTSEFDVSNPDKDLSIAKPEASQAAPAAETSNNPPVLETLVTKDVIEDADEAQNEDDQPLEEEHSTTNTHQNKQIVLNDDHTMNTDEFLNSSSGYAHTAKTGESNGDEGNSALKPPPDLYLPSEVLQGLRNLTPDEALDKLLSSFGAYIPTAADREKALQLEQEEHERRFYREIIEGDMLALLERDSTLYFNIKALFNKLQTPRTREDLFLRVTQAEAFLEQYAKHFQQLLDNS